MSLKSRLAKCSLTSCATLAATVLWAALPAHAVTGYVRVNQLGYENGTAM